MWSTASHIAEGDLVIIWLTRDVVQPLTITQGKDFNSKYGNYRQSDFIGVPFGSKVGSRNGKGFIHLLRPTPELWTMALPHRTQILYLADIAFITSYLDIRPGSRVIEAGTGSASFSHSVVRTIGSSGHLWSYEFHEARANKARDEFLAHGMADTVTLTHRNVCKDGFTVTDFVDSVFLDLPAPWDAVEHAKKALRKDRTTRICCFSPCMEQVLRTVTALNEAGFTEITMYETLLRQHDVTHVPVPVHIGEATEKLKQAEIRREEKRLRQIAAGRARVLPSDGAGGSSTSGTKRKRENGGMEGFEDDGNDTAIGVGGTVGDGQQLESESPMEVEDAATDNTTSVDKMGSLTSMSGPPIAVNKRVKVEAVGDRTAAVDDAGVDDYDANDAEMVVEDGGDGGMSNEKGGAVVPSTSSSNVGRQATSITTTTTAAKISVNKAMSEVRGHTSYLTFACLLPATSKKAATGMEGSRVEVGEGKGAKWRGGRVDESGKDGKDLDNLAAAHGETASG